MNKNNNKLSETSEHFRRVIVYCIDKSLQDDRRRYMAEFHPDSTNAIPHLIGDWINKNIKIHLACEEIEVVGFKRKNWSGRILIDRERHCTYTVMRTERFREVTRDIANGKRTTLHYLQTIIYTLNSDLKAPVKQISMFQEEATSFDNEYLEKDFVEIFHGAIGADEGYCHCVVLYDTEHFNLTEAAIVVLDKNFDEVERLSLNEYIRPDFALLTEQTPEVHREHIEAETEEDSANLISLRSDETSETPVELRHKKKKA